MTQRIFDTDNEEDMKLLWSILPTNTFKIRGMNGQSSYLFEDDNKCYGSICEDIIKINWQDKREITRPVNYEDMIGCVGWFWDDSKADDTPPCLGVLTAIAGGEYYTQVETWGYDNFRPAKKSELKFLEDK